MGIEPLSLFTWIFGASGAHVTASLDVGSLSGRRAASYASSPMGSPTEHLEPRQIRKEATVEARECGGPLPIWALASRPGRGAPSGQRG